MVKEFSLSSSSKVLILTNGVVLKRYDKINDCYDFKIIADIAVIKYSNGIVRVYGDFHNTEGVELNPNVNMMKNPNSDISDMPILLSDVLDNTEKLEGSYVLNIEPKSRYTTLYVDYDSFNEESYRKVKDIVSRHVIHYN